MKWKKVNEYYAVSDCGNYKIAKCICNGQEMFLLSYQWESLGWFKQQSELKKAAQEHEARLK